MISTWQLISSIVYVMYVYFKIHIYHHSFIYDIIVYMLFDIFNILLLYWYIYIYIYILYRYIKKNMFIYKKKSYQFIN